MIDNNIFYHNTIRKTVVAFGTIFNNIHIERRASDNTVAQTLKVPLSYGPKQKFLMRIRQQPNLSSAGKIEVSVPRMGFEITSIQYDAARKLAPTSKMKYVTSPTTMNSQYNPAPWNMNLSLHVLVKNQDDGLQILEQILPFFNPEYVVTVNDIPSMNMKHHLPIEIRNVSYDDVFEGDFNERTSIVWTLDFVAKINLYGPVYDSGVIKKVIATAYPNMPGNIVDGDNDRYTATVDPIDAQPTDAYDILEVWDKI